MHRNTYILIVFLGIFAALVAGVNIGKTISEPRTDQTAQGVSTPTVSQLQPTSMEQKNHIYTSKGCGVQFPYPDRFTITQDATFSAMLTSVASKESILVTCQKDIPRPPIPEGSIETMKLTNKDASTTISAKLYHDESPKDGEKIDALIYYNPKIKMDVFFAGYGPEFDTARQSLLLYP